MYDEQELLQLSGLQHFSFCRRQWALIHIEQQWEDNYRTVDGSLMHEKAHDKSADESRAGLLIKRGMRVHSFILGVSGECDVVEFHRGKAGAQLADREGLWLPYPIEYKRGHSKENNADRLQLCCQAMCLEEMFSCQVPEGALFYGETRRREKILLSEDLRTEVKQALMEMHDLYRRGYTPRVKPSKACHECSLKEICLPVINEKHSAREYILRSMKEDL